MMADRFCPIMIRALIRRIVASVSDGAKYHLKVSRAAPTLAVQVPAGEESCNSG